MNAAIQVAKRVELCKWENKGQNYSVNWSWLRVHQRDLSPTKFERISIHAALIAYPITGIESMREAQSLIVSIGFRLPVCPY